MTRQRPLERRLNGSAPGRSTACIGCKTAGAGDRNETTGFACYYPDHYQDTARMLRELEGEARGYREAGMTAIKMKIGLLPIGLDAERVAVVRDAIGPSASLMADANHAYTSASAIRMGRALETHDVLWFEEPVPPEDRQGYRRVGDAIDVPVAGGEAEFTRYGFRDLLLGECLDIAQPDLCCTGGFTEWQKIIALTTSFGVLTVPHVWGSGVTVAAALQALATAPPVPFTAAVVPLQNEPMIEYDRTHNRTIPCVTIFSSRASPSPMARSRFRPDRGLASRSTRISSDGTRHQGSWGSQVPEPEQARVRSSTRRPAEAERDRACERSTLSLRTRCTPGFPCAPLRGRAPALRSAGRPRTR